VATATWIFLIIGGAGVAVLALALFGTELDLGGQDVDGPITLEAVAAFAGVLGFGGAIANELIGGRTVVQIAAAGGLGSLAALPAGWLAARFSRAVRNMPTDTTPTRSDLVGAIGVVVTPIPSNGYGEVRVQLAGQPVKLNARADRPIASGTQIFVVEALSETSVHVETY